MNRTPINQTRNEAIWALRERGLTFAEIAERFNITKARVRAIYVKKAESVLRMAEGEFDPLLTPDDVMRRLRINKDQLTNLIQSMERVAR